MYSLGSGCTPLIRKPSSMQAGIQRQWKTKLLASTYRGLGAKLIISLVFVYMNKIQSFETTYIECTWHQRRRPRHQTPTCHPNWVGTPWWPCCSKLHCKCRDKRRVSTRKDTVASKTVRMFCSFPKLFFLIWIAFVEIFRMDISPQRSQVNTRKTSISIIQLSWPLH